MDSKKAMERLGPDGTIAAIYIYFTIIDGKADQAELYTGITRLASKTGHGFGDAAKLAEEAHNVLSEFLLEGESGLQKFRDFLIMSLMEFSIKYDKEFKNGIISDLESIAKSDGNLDQSEIAFINIVKGIFKISVV